MIPLIMMAGDALRAPLTAAAASSRNYSLPVIAGSYEECLRSINAYKNCLFIAEVKKPVCSLQNLMLDLDRRELCPVMIMYSITEDGVIEYSLSEEEFLPDSLPAAELFESALSGRYVCRRLLFRTARHNIPALNRRSLIDHKSHALYEIIVGCNQSDYSYYRSRYHLDLKDNGYHLFFWELSFNVYVNHNRYKDIYNMIGCQMKAECQEILNEHNGGEFFFTNYAEACIIINDISAVTDPDEKRRQINIIAERLAAVVGSRNAVSYLSSYADTILDFKNLYDTYRGERLNSFFCEDNIVRSDYIKNNIRRVDLQEVNDMLDRIVRYLNYNPGNKMLDEALKHLYIDILMPSMDLPMYYYCASVIGSTIIKSAPGLADDSLIRMIAYGHIQHSSIQAEYEQLLEIIRQVRGHLGSSRQTTDELVLSAIEFIQKNHHENITIPEIADALYISESYLNRLFQSRLNMSAMQYLIKYRITRAKDLLEHTQYPVFTVADLCGFRDVRNFSKTFKKHTGKTPRAYRIGLFE